jgi:hypothetical protein
MKTTTDLTMYPVKMQVQLLKANGKVLQMIVNAEKWEEVEDSINSTAIVSEETKNYFKNKFNK